MKTWISAFRLRTLPLALSCIGMAGFLAASSGHFDGLIFFLCCLTTIFLQVLSNLANDYGDSVHGADHADRKGPSRAVQSGNITAVQMKRAVIVLAILSFLSGLSLLWISFGTNWNEILPFLGLGLLSILAAIAYTMGKKPYGYMGLGDVSVLIFFGFVGVLGSYYLFAHTVAVLQILPALSCGLFAMAVLNINNIRDIASDLKAGKYSIPVRIGREKAIVYHWFLLGGGIVAATVYVALIYHSPFHFLYTLAIPFIFVNGRAVAKHESDALDPYLKQMALSTLLFVILFGSGILLAEIS